MQNKSESWIRINKDDLRTMCGKYWVLSRESTISNFEKLLVEEALKNNYNVLIDGTNLNPKIIETWQELAKKYSANITFKEFIIPYKEAIKRDSLRANKIGEDTIRIFYRKYYPELLSQELNEI